MSGPRGGRGELRPHVGDATAAEVWEQTPPPGKENTLTNRPRMFIPMRVNLSRVNSHHCAQMSFLYATDHRSEPKPTGSDKCYGAAQRKSRGTIPLGVERAPSSDSSEASSNDQGFGSAGRRSTQVKECAPLTIPRKRPVSSGPTMGTIVYPATASSTPEVIPLFRENSFTAVANGGKNFTVHQDGRSALNQIVRTRFPVLGFIAKTGFPNMAEATTWGEQRTREMQTITQAFATASVQPVVYGDQDGSDSSEITAGDSPRRWYVREGAQGPVIYEDRPAAEQGDGQNAAEAPVIFTCDSRADAERLVARLSPPPPAPESSSSGAASAVPPSRRKRARQQAAGTRSSAQVEGSDQVEEASTLPDAQANQTQAAGSKRGRGVADAK
jgi:hypothetical protein